MFFDNQIKLKILNLIKIENLQDLNYILNIYTNFCVIQLNSEVNYNGIIYITFKNIMNYEV